YQSRLYEVCSALFFFFSSRRRHTRSKRDWSSDVCSSDLANSAAGKHYQPSLQNQDYSLAQITYDREERSRLAVEQGEFTAKHFIQPHQTVLEQWAKNYDHLSDQK